MIESLDYNFGYYVFGRSSKLNAVVNNINKKT